MMMEERRLVRRAPKLSRHESAIPSEERCRVGEGISLHVEWLAIRIARPGCDVVQLEVGERRHLDHSVDRYWSRTGQFLVGQVDAQRRSLTDLEITCRIVRVWLGKDPTLIGERQRWNVTRRAANCAEAPLAQPHGGFQFAVLRDHAARRRERRLKDHCGCYIRPGQLVGESVVVGIRIDAEPLGRLDAVMMVEGVVRELA